MEESAAPAEEKLPHGYTNATRRVGDHLVEKRYLGSRRFDNARRELACLTGLADLLPVPEVVDSNLAEPLLVVRWVHGDHGQELIDRGEVDDLAFAEWVVRMHHADRVDILDALFDGAGWRPSWEQRQTTMVRKCHEVLAFCEETGWHDSAAWWREVIGATSAWTE